MIKVEDGNLTLKGKSSFLLLEVTIIIKAIKHELEKKGVPEEEAERALHDAYMFAMAKPEHLLELIKTHNPGEDIKWEEILN